MTGPNALLGPLLTGKTAIVTGGAKGIGAAVTRLFAAHGAHVVVVDTDASCAAALAGETAAITTVVADVTDPGVALGLAVHEADILVNNVGDFRRSATAFVDADSSEWDGLHQINLGHALHATHAVLPGMIERG